VPEGFTAAGSRGAEVFGREVGLFEKILVLGIFLFEEDFGSFKVKFVPVFARNVVNEVKNLLDGGFLDGTFFFSIFDFQVKSVDFEFAHVFAKGLFEDGESLFRLSEVVESAGEEVNEGADREFELVPDADLKEDFEAFPGLLVLDEQFANFDQNALLKHVRVVNISQNPPQLIWRNPALLSVRNVNLC
jgi:hypothetical protein